VAQIGQASAEDVDVMRESAGVVVIGAGIHGASTAYHLARRGARVTVLERAAAGWAATGRSSGLVRMHYDLAAESALAWLSYAYFANWSECVGGDAGFQRTGFLRIVPPAWEEALRANVADQQRMGIPTSVVDAHEIAQLAPALAVESDEIAAYEPDSGYADPAAACQSLLAAARAHGATIRQNCVVRSIDVTGDRVSAVVTADGRVAADQVVIAAGAWSPDVAATVGLQLPIRAWHHDTGFVTRPPFDGPLPTVIDDVHELYLRPEGEHLALVGLEDGNRIDDSPADDTRSDEQFVEHLVDRLCRRVPAFADGGLHSVHGGTDGITPDQRPMLGRYGPAGLVLQCGFSGTGFKIAPAVGLAISELVLDGDPRSADISVFDPARFDRGEPIVADHPYAQMWR
jgi:sarcosine oxidase, subunit beta